MWHRLGLRRLLGRDERDSASSSSSHSHSHSHSAFNSGSGSSSPNGTSNGNSNSNKPYDNITRRLSRRVGVGLPRATTFKRQNSERRDRLSPSEVEPRRAVSADRRRAVSSQRTRSRSPQPAVGPRLSAPEVQWRDKDEATAADMAETAEETMVDEPNGTNHNHNHIEEDDGTSDLRSEWSRPLDPEVEPEPDPDPLEESRILEKELEERWILNLTMHFRDRSAREKLFVTYAETPNRWRRISLSCDYRNAEPESLERDLSDLRRPKDRCARIYESLRDSLPQIQFYDTVTNLKLETRDGRLHVHVTEDVNEIIPYPSIFSIGHLPGVRLVPEKRLHFMKHESGFVYHVQVDGRACIKKEIPGPDMVDEFLYEINALHELTGSPNVIQIDGIVVDDDQEVIKGLLISYAEQGALVDMLYFHGGNISWSRRERWARQIVQGLCEIHEAGFVQGDFTLSNIVLDADDNAKIIDINRRGCPVGWEPPEIVAKLESKQRISMYIGVKTDIYQLGMTLWALATENDEPERECRPLVLGENVRVPDYYRKLVSICLSPIPQHRLSAKELLALFPRPAVAEQPLPPPMVHTPPASMGIGLRSSPLPFHNVGAFPAPVAFLQSQTGPVEGLDHHHLPAQLSLDDIYSSSRYQYNSEPVSPYDSYIPSSDDGRRPRSAGSMEHARPCVEELQQERVSEPLRPDQGPSLTRQNLAYSQTMTSSQKHSNNTPLSAYPTPVHNPEHPPQFETNGHTHSMDHHSTTTTTQQQSSSDSTRHQESPASTTSTQSSEPTRTPVTDVGHGQGYITDHDPAYADWSRKMPSYSVSSLIHSILPINPASNSSELIPPAADRLSSRLTLRSALD